jgi:hypothetical protein
MASHSENNSGLGRHHSFVGNRIHADRTMVAEQLVLPHIDTSVAVSVPEAGSLLYDPFASAMMYSDGTTFQQVSTDTSGSTSSYLTVNAESALTGSRRLINSPTVTITDNGPGSTLQLNAPGNVNNNTSTLTVGNETATMPNSRRLVSSGTVTVVDNGPGGSIQLTAVAAASTISNVTVADEHSSAPLARRLVGSDSVTLVDNGAGTTLELHAVGAATDTTNLTVTDESLTLPNSRRLANSSTVTVTDNGAGSTVQLNVVAGSLSTASVLTLANESGTLANSRQLVSSSTVTVVDGGPSGTVSLTAVPSTSPSIADTVEHISVNQFVQADPDPTKTHSYISVVGSVAGGRAYGTLGDGAADGVRKTVFIENNTVGGYALTITHYLSPYGDTDLTKPYIHFLDGPGQSISLVWNNTKTAWQQQADNRNYGPAAEVVVGCDDDVPATVSLGTTTEAANSTTVTITGAKRVYPYMVGAKLEWDAPTFSTAGSTVTVIGSSFVITRTGGAAWVSSMVGGTLTITSSGQSRTIVAFIDTSNLILDSSVTASASAYTLTYQPMAVYQTGTVETTATVLSPGMGAVFSADYVGSRIYIRKVVSSVVTAVYTRTIGSYDPVAGTITIILDQGDSDVGINTSGPQPFTIAYRQTVTAVANTQSFTVNVPLQTTAPPTNTATLRLLRPVRAIASNGQCIARGINIPHNGLSTVLDVLVLSVAYLKAQGGGTLRIRGGNYTLADTATNSSAVTFDSTTGQINVCGEGRGTVLLRGGFKKSCFALTNCSGVSISDIKFAGSTWVNTYTYANDPLIANSGPAILNSGSTKCSVRDCYFNQISGAIDSSTSADTLLVDRCMVEECRGGIRFADSTSYASITNTSFLNVFEPYVVSFLSGSTNCSVTNCDFTNTSGGHAPCVVIDGGNGVNGDMTATSSNYMVVNSCHFTNNDYPGVFIGNNVYSSTIRGNTFLNCAQAGVGAAAATSIDLQAQAVGDGAVSVAFPYAHDITISGNTFDNCGRAITCQARGNVIKDNTVTDSTYSSVIEDGNYVSNPSEVVGDRNLYGDLVDRTVLTSYQTSNTSSTPVIIGTTYDTVPSSNPWQLMEGNTGVNKVEFRLSKASDTHPMTYGGYWTSIALGMAMDPTGFSPGSGTVRIQIWQVTQAGNGQGLFYQLTGLSIPDKIGTTLLTDPSIVIPLPANTIPVAGIQYRIAVNAETTGRRVWYRVSTNGNSNGNTSGISGISNDNIDYTVNAVGAGYPTSFVDIGQLGNNRGQLRIGGSQGTPISRLALYHLTGNYITVGAQSDVTITKAAVTAAYTGTGLVTVAPGPSTSTVTLSNGAGFEGSLVGGTITVAGDVARTILSVPHPNVLTVNGVVTIAAPKTYTLQPLGGVRTTDQVMIANTGAVPAGLLVGNPYVSSDGNISFKVTNVTTSSYTAAAAYDFWVHALSQ